MQSLDVISVNLWQIIISLCNLTILYLLLKKFLYEPVRKVLAARQAAIDSKFEEADNARANAKADEKAWSEKMAGAKATSDAMIAEAARKAEKRGEEIIEAATLRAEGIVDQAFTAAELEKKKAESQIRRQIVDISSLMTEKILEREINAEDHMGFIDSMIDQIGASDEGDK